ncbi:MAG: L,D-transpeptidase [Candidatus Promineifilaceae bacterium]|nr:L,D-transpeptidase [Candidatus Promineifilaceae bacterium]
MRLRMQWTVPFALLLLALLFFAGTPPAAAGCTPEGARESVCNGRVPATTFSVPRLRPGSILTGTTYGWIEDYARFSAAPDPDAPYSRYAAAGFFYGPVKATATDDEGNDWYRVWGHWLPAHYYHVVDSTHFAGVNVHYRPRRPFGWVLTPFRLRPEPAAPAPEDAPELQRYDFVQIYGVAHGRDGALWYDVGDGRWVRYHALALTQWREQPGDVGEDAYWVDVDLTQQTFTAYEGDRMVYAGLISSGLPRWPTRVGLFRVWSRHETTRMSGGVLGDDYYYIAEVPHTLYFDGEIALHGAYWHDDFGRPKSHGCVNMPPRAAEWVYYWSENAPGDLRVWVHYSSRSDVQP